MVHPYCYFGVICFTDNRRRKNFYISYIIDILKKALGERLIFYFEMPDGM